MNGINVASIDSRYSFIIDGVSYIGNPRSNTAMYVGLKVQSLLSNLKQCTECLVFAETGIIADEDIKQNNCVVFADNPQYEYAKFVNQFAKSEEKRDSRRHYNLTDIGYYVGDNVKIPEDCYVEPGSLIGHDVIIGKSVHILAGAVIKHSVIGDNCIINENAVIGAKGFTMTQDESGNKYRIPTLGKVVIGSNVEIGACGNISCGSAGDTIIEDYAKIDALVHIGHDVHIHKNVEITAGSIIGGFVDIAESSFVGINSCIRNRRTIGANDVIGMGSVVTKSVDCNETVVGNPARKFVHKDD